MTALTYKHLVPALLAVVIFIVSINAYESVLSIWKRQTTAIEWVSATAETKTVKPGGVLTIIYESFVNKQCPSDIRAFLVAPDGSVPVRFPETKGGYSSPSPDMRKIRVNVQIPTMSDPGLAPLTSGKYKYRTLATRYCPEGVEDDASVPEVEFYLEVP